MISLHKAESEHRELPGRLLPFILLSISVAELIHLCEEVMGNVLLIIIFSPEDELHPLRWCVLTKQRHTHLRISFEIDTLSQ